MKKTKSTLACLALAGLMTMPVASCSKKEESKAPAKAKTEQKSPLPNYRYVDMDSVLTRYNLAKDFDEEMLRLQNNAEGQMKQHQNKIQNAAASMQNKMQNNGYLSEASYKQDEQNLANLQNNAQRSAEALQNNIMQANMQAQKTLNDSIMSFIESYNKKHGYDAILWKSATLYINPDLDITDEVVEGLNARYNKVKK